MDGKPLGEIDGTKLGGALGLSLGNVDGKPLGEIDGTKLGGALGGALGE
jgi:hypothetical protein